MPQKTRIQNNLRFKHSYYSPKWVANYYDEYGEQEWERFTRRPANEVSLFLHTHYLEQFVKPGSRVLDVGAGPGRFTQILANIGCRVVVADISQVQLDLHRKYAEALDFEDAVEDRLQLDICDMSCLPSESFDAVICYGGPLSYVFDQASAALGECARVCRSDGHVLASVMSLWGGAHRNLGAILSVPPENNRKITETGDLTPENWADVHHRCHMFRPNEVKQMVHQAELVLVVISASNCISNCWDDLLTEIKDDPKKWQELLRMELAACSEEGCLGMGSHIIVVGRKEQLRDGI